MAQRPTTIAGVPKKVKSLSQNRLLFWTVLLRAAVPGAALDSAPAALAAPELEPPRLLVSGGRTVGWAPKGDWIAYDRRGASGYSHLYVARPDGGSERCLTCDAYELRKRHAGNPAWHPSGEYLVFQVEKPVKFGGDPLAIFSVPGGNLGNDLWAITFDGKRFWNLTGRGDRGGRVAAPRFSFEGDKLVWSERVASGGGTWGRWSLQVAEFQVRRGVPRLKKPRGYRPGEQKFFYESCSFTPDDRGILFSANLDPGQKEGELDLYRLDLESGDLDRLTATPSFDRFCRLTPDGRHVVWASNRDIRARRRDFDRRDRTTVVALDLWMMSLDGRQPVRLTRFNDALSPDYFGAVMVGAPAWSREGDRLILPMTPVLPAGTRPTEDTGGGLYLIEIPAAGERSVDTRE